MRIVKWGAFALATILGVSATSSGSATTQQLERFGNVYALSVCGKFSAPGDAHCFAKVVTDARGNIKEWLASPKLARNATPSGYGPSDLRSAYKVTTSGTSSYTIAIVDAYGYPNAEKDLAVYRAQYGLPACTTANGCFKKVNQNGVAGSYPRTDTGWSQEQALDLDMASAMCPNCKIILVQASTASLGNLAKAVNTAVAMGANAISNSYGGSETGTASYETSYNHPGIAITVSSGDSGYGVSFPASSPHVTAVGGTSLTKASNSRGWNETVWIGAGSGCSKVFAKPTWQNDGNCARRTVADVSAVADPNTGVAVYGPMNARRSGWMIFGGTSVSAPLIAGLYGVNGGTANFGQDPYNHASALFDVTSGSNGSCGGSYLCTGAAGYDGPTGLGTPNGVSAF
ncbi:MAG TPA: S53 family peptidase [Sphingomicrobium sp.]|jgi:subtilase family serine protease|nr:S53 family peptidase [Sphingomicrobium sp.]